MFSPMKKIILFNVLFNSFRMLIGATSAIYLLNHGISLIDIAFMKTMQSVIFFMLDIPSSYLADKISRKYMLILSVIFGGLWLIITGIAESKAIFYLAEVFNSFSLSIFGGVYFSYLIDNTQDNEKEEIHKILGKNNKYQYLFMAFSALLGSYLSSYNDRLVWILAGSGCLLIVMALAWSLPKPVVRKRLEKSSIWEDLKKIHNVINNKSSSLHLIFIALAANMVYFQIILQYWQPFVSDSLTFYSPNDTFYGFLFLFILLAQSISGWISSNVKSNAKLYFYSMILLWLSNIICLLGLLQYNLLIPVSLVIMFGANQTLTMSLRAHYHSLISSELRSTFDSLLSSLSKLVILVLMPGVVLLTQRYGWLCLTSVLVGLTVLASISSLLMKLGKGNSSIVITEESM
ncbi:MFS transporter [Dickeya poaceiphila]|uniref:MFS transporter n=2 Tax=Dickeya poaceiphila TaxID=568768 RepID=A0A5B8HEH0_9GAMM|nr:MFS transporter [Dickeya poaceiphila]